MTKKLERLRRWLPWADRAVGAPGAAGDWKGLLKKLWPGGGTLPLWFEKARGWVMDSTIPDWVLLGLAYGGMGLTVVLLARWAASQRRAAQAEARVARRDERAESSARRLNRRTLNRIALGETEVSPEDAWRIATDEVAGYILVEEFIRQHPEACRQDPPMLDRDLFVRWLVAPREAKGKGGK